MGNASVAAREVLDERNNNSNIIQGLTPGPNLFSGVGSTFGSGTPQQQLGSFVTNPGGTANLADVVGAGVGGLANNFNQAQAQLGVMGQQQQQAQNTNTSQVNQGATTSQGSSLMSGTSQAVNNQTNLGASSSSGTAASSTLGSQTGSTSGTSAQTALTAGQQQQSGATTGVSSNLSQEAGTQQQQSASTGTQLQTQQQTGSTGVEDTVGATDALRQQIAGASGVDAGRNAYLQQTMQGDPATASNVRRVVGKAIGGREGAMSGAGGNTRTIMEGVNDVVRNDTASRLAAAQQLSGSGVNASTAAALPFLRNTSTTAGTSAATNQQNTSAAGTTSNVGSQVGQTAGTNTSAATNTQASQQTGQQQQQTAQQTAQNTSGTTSQQNNSVQTAQGTTEQNNTQNTAQSQNGTSANVMQGVSNVLSSMFGTDTLAQAGIGAAPQNETGGGGGCCFIFLEALNGKLPAFVRECRDEMATGSKRNGYNKMAVKLVPWMRKSRLVRWMVNAFMVKPFLRCGNWYKKADPALPGYRFGFIFKPVCYTWLAIWNNLGKA